MQVTVGQHFDIGREWCNRKATVWRSELCVCAYVDTIIFAIFGRLEYIVNSRLNKKI